MPGVQDTRAQIGKSAADTQAEEQEHAEENARKQEAIQLQEAQAIRKVHRDLELLSVNDTWGPRAQSLSTDETMLKKIMECVRHAARRKIDNVSTFCFCKNK